MPTTRQQKVSKQLQKDIAEIIQRQGMQAYDGALITVMGVDINPDLSFAKVFLSIFPSSKADSVMSLINTKLIRTEVGKRVKNQLRIVPEITFTIDTSLDYVDNIERLLKQNPTKSEE
ncbi:MAG: 30S ribosome-binding factor RbfA [Prevotellaceae bacterium]|jgi:ribosome-binding factor A|nr:30S ribosome-binding factor RbfA [Prevotellaceae bacterium]